MFFLASKVFWLLVQPISLVTMLVIGGMVLMFWRRRRLGLLMAGAGLSVLVVSAYTSLGLALIVPLENRFERPSVMPAAVTTIIMLGGATVGQVSSARGISEIGEAGDRVIETFRLAQLYPAAKVVLTGGSGVLGGEALSEASIAAHLLESMGIEPNRLVLEEASRNTEENADLTSAMVGVAGGTSILVTSAFHMPRSVGLFRSAGMLVVPWPVDYRSMGSEGLRIDLANPMPNLSTLTVAVREWVGLVVYAASGRIDDVFPAPLIR